ncbi:type IV pilus assembly protein PilP [Sphaerotilus hippei]|uniref:Type IV pilus assembly protein PilP n=1 Tax=Sphaerotilus hippei TaxID=744406 RepID=A0A318H1X2_9BURK|nr:pilus assembly protein PilP [Sphaerotilus hippei]PXW97124.1 type IV pilus assembly protein PilP [Sphaerotilus hippei]
MSRIQAARPLALAALALATLLTAGCGDTHEELQAWMDQQRLEVRPRVSPLVPPRKFDPQPYLASLTVDPFSNQKLQVAIKQEDRQPNSVLAAEMNRRREPLEAYTLDSLVMVGSVVRGGVPHALLKADSLLYQVRVGNYLGQNFGRVTRISETEITLREIVQDAVGEWVERSATLTLQERAQEKGR